MPAKSGVTACECPNCGGERVHAVVILGAEVFLACQHCKAVRMDEEAAMLPHGVAHEGAPRQQQRPHWRH